MTPADVLPVSEGDRVLDLCAAPGGKATALGAKLRGKGLLVANDVSAPRARALLHNLETFGITNAVVTNARPEVLAAQLPVFFDKVLVDAPCSGEGMFRKDEEAVRAWSEDKPQKCAAVSRSIILSAADMLRPGGMMLYSTCTFSVEENEAVIAHLLRERPEMKLVKIPEREGFAPGLEVPEGPESADFLVRLWPHKIGGEGHFMALLQKADDAPYRDEGKAQENGFARKGPGAGRASKEELALLEEFLAGIGLDEKLILREGTVKTAASKAYLIPNGAPDTGRIPVLRCGLFLGEMKKNRFEPSQSLAMAINAASCPEAVIRLEADDPAIVRYLKGEVLESADLEGKCADPIDGWKPVCVESYPLGWGKLTGGRLKNHLGAGWRIQ